MKQRVSIVYLTEKMPMATISNFVNMREVIGEKYRNNN